MSCFDFTKFLNALRLPSSAWLAVLISSSILFLLPNEILQELGLDTVLSVGKIYVGLALLVSVSVLGSRLLEPIGTYLRDRIKESVLLRRWQNNIHDLTPRHKEILHRYLSLNRKTQALRIDDGDIGYLISQKIIFQSSKVSDETMMRFDFSIQTWAWDYLKQNPHLIDWNGTFSGKTAKQKANRE